MYVMRYFKCFYMMTKLTSIWRISVQHLHTTPCFPEYIWAVLGCIPNMWIEWNCRLGSRWVISNLLSLADPPIAVIGETRHVMINLISSLRCAGSYSMTMVCKVKQTRTQTLWEVVYSPSVIQINGVYVHVCGMTEKRPAVCDVEISEKAPATMCSLNTWEQVGLSVNRPWLLCFSQF